MFRSPTPVVKNIIIINVVIALIAGVIGFPLNNVFGLYVVFSDNFAPYQFLTYMWLHGGFRHIFFNMLMLFFLGPLLEQVWGSKRFATFYLVCGIGAGVLYGAVDFIETLPLKRDTEAYVANPSPEAFERYIVKYRSRVNKDAAADLIDLYYEDQRYEERTKREVMGIYEAAINLGVMVGASGAIYGLLFALAYLFPNTEFFLLFPPIPIKVKYLAFALAAISVYSEFNRSPGDNVAHLAHLSGMLIAFIMLRFWKNNTKRFY